MSEQVTLTLKVKRQLTDPTAPPKPAHKFNFVRVGTEIVLEVGYYDLPELREAVEQSKARAERGDTSGEHLEVVLHVTDRFVLSPQGVEDLARVAEQLRADMVNVVASLPETGAERK